MPYKTSSTERDTWLFVVANEKQAGGIDVSDALTTKAEEIQEMLNEAYVMTKELEVPGNNIYLEMDMNGLTPGTYCLRIKAK